MSVAPPFYDVTDLHALVDGELDDAEATRLRGLLAPADTARVAQWRRQNEMLRAAFATVAYEPVPLSLSLVAPTRPMLHAVPPVPAATPGRARRWGALAGLGCGLVAAITAVFFLSDLLDSSVPARTSSAASEIGALLTTRTLATLGAADTPAPDAALRLPNLASAGLTLETSDVSETDAGLSTCGIYTGRGVARFALCAMPGAGGDEAPRAAAPHVISWRNGGHVYALAGPLPADELSGLSARISAAAGRP